jgi:hypothetical protein
MIARQVGSSGAPESNTACRIHNVRAPLPACPTRKAGIWWWWWVVAVVVGCIFVGSLVWHVAMRGPSISNTSTGPPFSRFASAGGSETQADSHQHHRSREESDTNGTLNAGGRDDNCNDDDDDDNNDDDSGDTAGAHNAVDDMQKLSQKRSSGMGSWSFPPGALATFLLTYACYACLYFTRKPFSVVKLSVGADMHLNKSSLGMIDTAFLSM